MPESLKIAFFDAKPYDIDSFQQKNQNFAYEIKFFTEKLNKHTAILAKGFDIICAFVNDTLSGEVLEKIKAYGIKLIALRCAGYNNVDLKAAFRNIHIARVPAYSPYAVAEHAAALILSLNRKIHKAYARVRETNFSLNGLMGFDLYNKTAGVIGTGKIGKIMIDILLGFGLKIIAFDPFPDRKFAEEKKITYSTLAELYKNADIISLHCPLSEETKHLINKESINKMKTGVMIINTSRGALIDTQALINGLKSKKIGCAGLDVYEEESEYFFEDKSDVILDDDILARLLTFNNVLITSHQAFFTKEALSNIAETTLNNIKEFFEKNTLTNEICYKCGLEPCPKKEKKLCF